MISGSESTRSLGELAALVRLLEQETGIVMPEYRWPLLEAELELEGGHPTSTSDVSRALAGDEAARERLISILSVPETYLFRHIGHFELLGERIDELRLHGRGCRVLSAGCATGEEVWSAAAVLASRPAPTGAWHSATGWELCEERLQQARAGRYTRWSSRNGFYEYSMFFHNDGKTVTVDPRLRDLVAFKQANLVSGHLPCCGPFDVIFFRNVALYWRQETVDHVWSRLTALAAPDALVMVGPSDPVIPSPVGWEQLLVNGARAYRRQTPASRCTTVRLPRAVATASTRAPSWPKPTPPPGSSRHSRFPELPGAVAPIAFSQPLATNSDARSESPLPLGGHLDEVRALADRGQYENALEILERENGRLGSSVEAKMWHGILTLNLGSPTDAVRMFRQCVFLRPDEADLRRWLAVAYEAAGRAVEAHREHRNAAEMVQS